jgi:hypothetical protein
MKLRTTMILILALAAPAVFAEESKKSPVKPGKWQWTMEMEIPGMPVKMPPIKFEHCVTEEDAKKAEGGIPKDKKQKDCKYGDPEIDGNTIRWTIDCPKQKMTGKGEITYEDDSMTGRMDMVSNGQEMSAKYSGKYLGSCEK